MRRILVPLDGSTRAERVLPYVRTLASTFGAKVDLLHVIPGGGAIGERGPSDPLAFRLAQADRTDYLIGRAAELEEEGLRVVTSVRAGGAAEVIVCLLRGGEYDLVGLTPHGAGCGSSLSVGCTAAGVILNSHVSILLVQGEDPQEGDQPTGFSLGSVMAGVDSSCPRIDRAVAVAAAIARVSGSALNVVHTPCRSEITSRLLRWSQPESGQLPEVESREIRLRVEQVARCAGGKDLEVKQQFLGTADTLCDLVTREKPGLVVLGSHRWSDPLGRHFSGTAARRTIGAPRPMLVLQDLPTKWTRDRWDSPWGRRDAHVERTRKRGPSAVVQATNPQ